MLYVDHTAIGGVGDMEARGRREWKQMLTPHIQLYPSIICR